MATPQQTPDRSEGDVNTSAAREAFVAGHVDPAGREILTQDAQYFLRQSLSTPCLNAIVRAEGSYLIDTAGRKILDFHGNNVHQLGHGHPAVVAAVTQQLKTLPFCPRRYTNAPAVELARTLSEVAPIAPTCSDAPAKVLLAPGGTLAIGMAMKIVRAATGRHKTISMWGSFHGASLDAISIGGQQLFRRGMEPLLSGCLHVSPYDSSPGTPDSASAIEEMLAAEGDIGAVIAEPMRWTTVEVPPKDYWPRIRAACDAHGALLVLDEIPACLGRTGRLFCCEHFNVEPDIVVIGKGLGGGVFPLAAVIARADLDVAPEMALGHYTHEKSPVGAAAALATLDVIDAEGLLARTEQFGADTLNKLRNLQTRCDVMTDVRGLGLQLAVEIGGDSASARAERILYTCLENGLSFKVSAGNVLTLSPPLTVTDEEMDKALAILAEAIADCGMRNAD